MKDTLHVWRTIALAALSFLALDVDGVAENEPPGAVVSDSVIDPMLVTRVDLQKRATGIVVGIVEPKGNRLLAYGQTALGKAPPVNGDTVFEIGSLTKVFTALLLADMVQRGEVALNDPVVKYLPADLRVSDPNEKQITLADLATHTSGLPLRPGNLVSKDPENPYAGYTTDLLVQFFASIVPAQRPGSHYEYSNVGYGLLGEALARRAGQSFEQLLRARITQPLGMNDTRFALTPQMQARLATGYNPELLPAKPWHFGALAPAGALRSTANDLLKFLYTILGYEKSPLTPAIQAMLATRHPGGMAPATEIALAWNVFTDHGREIAWKNGSVGGFRAFLGYDPKTRIGVVALANAQTAMGADDIGLHLLDPQYPVDLTVPKPHKAIALKPVILDRYVGRYRYSPTDVITVAREGDHLVVSGQGFDKLKLFPESEREFFLKEIDAQMTFVSQGAKPATAALWHQGGQTEKGVRLTEN